MDARIDARIKPVLRDLRTGLEALYGPRLEGLYLFGSYARGEARPDSDLDVLIVLDAFTSYWAELKHTEALISGLSLQYEVCLSRVLARREDWHQKRTFFLESVRGEALPA